MFETILRPEEQGAQVISPAIRESTDCRWNNFVPLAPGRKNADKALGSSFRNAPLVELLQKQFELASDGTPEA